jgi:hypothetical protein
MRSAHDSATEPRISRFGWRILLAAAALAPACPSYHSSVSPTFDLCVLAGKGISDGCVKEGDAPVIDLGSLHIGEEQSRTIAVTCSSNSVGPVTIDTASVVDQSGIPTSDANYVLTAFRLNDSGTEDPVELPQTLQKGTGELRLHLTYKARRPDGVIQGASVLVVSKNLQATMPVRGNVAGCRLNWANCDSNPNDCETDLATNPEHCGACSNTCFAETKQAYCESGSCRQSSIPPTFDLCVLAGNRISDGCVKEGGAPVIDLGSLHIGEEQSRTIAVTCSGNSVGPVTIDTVSVVDQSGMPVSDANYALTAFQLNDSGAEDPIKLPQTLQKGSGELRLHVTYKASRPAGVIQGTSVLIASKNLQATVPVRGNVAGCRSNWANCDSNPNDCETDLTTNPEHCGACSNTCFAGTKQARCESASCRPCAEDGVLNNACTAALDVGTIDLGKAAQKSGNIVPVNTSDYFKVTFGGGCASGYHPVISIDNADVLFDLYQDNCSTTVECSATGDAAGSTGLHQWETTCASGAASYTAGAWRDLHALIGGTMLVRVYAKSTDRNATSCLPYKITFSNAYPTTSAALP